MRLYLTLLVGLAASVGSTAHGDPARLAWIGLERGPLPPADAEALEKLLLDDLDGYDSFRLVDVSGHALDARLLASEAALVARLKDEGIDLALEFKTQRALKKFEQAIAVFETRLVQLLDYELLHDTLLAKAEAQFQSGNKGAAKATLKELAALSPKRTPNQKTHQPGLVKLWTEAEEELGAAGSINIACEGCTVQVDAQPLGPAPLLATRIRPGKHYLVARWPHGFSYQAVQVAPGREAKIVLEQSGPAEETRVAWLATIERRAGVAEATALAQRAVKLAQSEGALLAVIRSDTNAKRWLLLVQHDAKGEVLSIVRAPLDTAVQDERTSTIVKRMGAVFFVDKKRGDQLLALDGTVTAGEQLAAQVYEGVPDRAPAPPLPAGDGDGAGDATDPPPDVPPPPVDLDAAFPPPLPPVVEAQPLTGQWWFWTMLAGAVAVAGTGVGLGVWAGSRGSDRTDFEVILP